MRTVLPITRGAALALAVALAWPLAVADAQTAPRIEFEKYTLPNGLDVILHEDHSIPVVAVNVWYHVGSGNEKPGRTGFAHLFEHMMFQGSQNHDDEYFKPLQQVGASINGSTNADRTNYWENVPAEHLELALWLEADRMGFLLPAMTQERLDNQRDVVKNERRQNYENRPYGKASLILAEMLYPSDHPYSWPTIGSQEDLSAASMEDISEFFRTYYAPNNASLVIAGDFDPEVVKPMVEKHFGTIPPGPPVDRISDWRVELDAPKRAIAEDNVRLARLNFAWHTPAYFAPGDAEFDLLANILTSGKTSRLYRSLVYEREIAQEVFAFQASREMGSVFQIVVTARADQDRAAIERALEAELDRLLERGITADELAQARTGWQASFVRRLERIGGFGGIADQLNSYNTYLGDPGRFEWDFARYADPSAEDVMRYARRYLDPEKRATLWIVPQGERKAVAVEFDRSRKPDPVAERGFTPPEVRRAELSNGLDLLVVRDPALPLVQASVVVRSGFADDPTELPGVASLTAELLDEGTRSRDALAIAEELKSLGANLSSGSSFDESTVSLNVLKEKLDAGLALMADVVLQPSFPEEELERQRRIYQGRIEQESKEAQTTAIKTFLRTLYGPEHPYGQSFTGTGTPESIERIARSDLAGFYRANYKPNNAAVVIAGDITLEEARAKVERAFGSWSRGEIAAAAVPDPQPPSRTQVYIVDKPGAAQSVIVAGLPALRRDSDDYLAFEVMNNVFGGKFSSRLNLNLREDKGYSYGVRSIFLASRGVGPFAMLAPVQTQSTKESLAEIMKELRELVGPRPVTAQELADAKGYIIKGYPQQFETLGGITGRLADIFTYGLPLDEWERYVRGIEGITAEQATAAARKYLDPDALLIVVVGDREVIEPGIRELGLGEVQHLAAGAE